MATARVASVHQMLARVVAIRPRQQSVLLGPDGVGQVDHLAHELRPLAADDRRAGRLEPLDRGVRPAFVLKHGEPPLDQRRGAARPGAAGPGCRP